MKNVNRLDKLKLPKSGTLFSLGDFGMADGFPQNEPVWPDTIVGAPPVSEGKYSSLVIIGLGLDTHVGLDICVGGCTGADTSANDWSRAAAKSSSKSGNISWEDKEISAGAYFP